MFFFIRHITTIQQILPTTILIGFDCRFFIYSQLKLISVDQNRLSRNLCQFIKIKAYTHTPHHDKCNGMLTMAYTKCITNTTISRNGKYGSRELFIYNTHSVSEHTLCVRRFISNCTLHRPWVIYFLETSDVPAQNFIITVKTKEKFTRRNIPIWYILCTHIRNGI